MVALVPNWDDRLSQQESHFIYSTTNDYTKSIDQEENLETIIDLLNDNILSEFKNIVML